LDARAPVSSYSASYGAGNVIDLPPLEKTNGRYGYAGTVAPRSKNSAYAVQRSGGTSASAYSPERRALIGNRHRRHSH
jgi:hypothetical protein